MNQWGRQSMGKDSRTLALVIVIVGILGYLFFPNFFKADPTTTETSLYNDQLSTYDTNDLNSSSSSSQLFPSVNSTITSGYWVLFISNGTSQQLSVTAQDYAFLQGLIQSDSKGIGATTVFLVANDQIHQYIVSNETYSVISNMATINARASNTSTSSTPLTTILPTTTISETLTISNPSTTGFTVTLNPALNGLMASSFTFLNSIGTPVTITSATTSDNGATYAIRAELSAGQTYTVTAKATGYTFGTAQIVTVPSTTISETLTVSNPSTSGFAVALNPALNGLTTSNFTLVNSLGNPVALTSATSSADGVTYVIIAAMSAGQTYTLTATAAGYTFGTAQNVVVPS